MEINTGPKDFSNKHVMLFLETQDNPFYYQYVYAICKEITGSGGYLQVVTIAESFEWHKIRSSLRYLRRKRALKALERDMAATFPSVKHEHESSNLNVEISQRAKSALHGLKLVNQLTDVLPKYRYLGPSLHSLCTSAFTMSSDPLAKIAKYRTLLERACAKYIWHLQIAQNYIQNYGPDVIIFLNGRTPEQAAFKEIAENLDVPWLALEHGAKPGKTYFLEKFQTQDRLKTQELIKNSSRQLNPQELERVLLKTEMWIHKQSSDRKQNPTLGLRDLSVNDLGVGHSIFPIFTSSIDEEMSCPNWSEDNVRSLTSRSILLSELAIKNGLIPVVVLHPNTLNKRWHDLSLVYSELNKNNLTISLPWSPISSYEYLERSNLVATWRSTIGLEGILRNKPLILLSDSVYDELVSFSTFERINQAISKKPRIKETDTKFAKLVINYYLNFGYDLLVNLDSDDLVKINKYEKILPLGGLIPSIRNKIRKFIRPLKVYGATPREVFDFLSYFMPRKAVESVMIFLITRYRY